MVQYIFCNTRDHDHTDLASEISDTSLDPAQAARETIDKMSLRIQDLGRVLRK